MMKHTVLVGLLLGAYSLSAMEYCSTNVTTTFNICQIHQSTMKDDSIYLQCNAGLIPPENKEWCELVEISLSLHILKAHSIIPHKKMLSIYQGNPILYEPNQSISIVPKISKDNWLANIDPRATAEGNFAYELAAHTILCTDDLTERALEQRTSPGDLLSTFMFLMVLDETGQIVLISRQGLVCIYDLLLKRKTFMHLGHPVDHVCVTFSDTFGIMIASDYIDEKDGETKVSIYSLASQEVIWCCNITPQIFDMTFIPQSDYLVILGARNQSGTQNIFTFDVPNVYKVNTFNLIKTYELPYYTTFCTAFGTDSIIIKNELTSAQEVRSLYTFEELVHFEANTEPGYTTAYMGLHTKNFHLATQEHNTSDDQNSYTVLSYGDNHYAVSDEFILHDYRDLLSNQENIVAHTRQGLLRRKHPSLAQAGLLKTRKARTPLQLHSHIQAAQASYEEFERQSKQPRKLTFDDLESPSKKPRTSQ